MTEKRFNRTVLDEFFRMAFCTLFYKSVELLQTDRDAWLASYNQERPHQGYCNMGRRPIDTVSLFLRESGSAPQLDPAIVRHDA